MSFTTSAGCDAKHKEKRERMPYTVSEAVRLSLPGPSLDGFITLSVLLNSSLSSTFEHVQPNACRAGRLWQQTTCANLVFYAVTLSFLFCSACKSYCMRARAKTLVRAPCECCQMPRQKPSLNTFLLRSKLWKSLAHRILIDLASPK